MIPGHMYIQEVDENDTRAYVFTGGGINYTQAYGYAGGGIK